MTEDELKEWQYILGRISRENDSLHEFIKNRLPELAQIAKKTESEPTFADVTNENLRSIVGLIKTLGDGMMFLIKRVNELEAKIFTMEHKH